jgi:hypothetical protein
MKTAVANAKSMLAVLDGSALRLLQNVSEMVAAAGLSNAFAVILDS